MNSLPLRTDGYPHYTLDVTLEDTDFTFEFLWNTRGGFWTFSISDSAGDVLLSGRKIVVSAPLIARFKDERMPAGELVAVDTTGSGTGPTLEDFGNRVVLLYMTAAEVAAL